VSISQQIVILKSLSQIDATLSRLQADLAAERTKNEGRLSRKAELTSRTQSIEWAVKEMEKTRQELVLELRQVATQVDKAREKLTRCRNEKEANAATRELEELRRIHREREKEIEKLDGLIADGRADVAKAASERDAVLAELGETADAAKTRLKELEDEIALALAEREKRAVGADKQILRRYDAVRSKRGSGLSEILNGTCVACHISISPMLYQQIMRQQELHACPSCHRILYFLPASAADGPATGEA
jgi:uncharacterized protein